MPDCTFKRLLIILSTFRIIERKIVISMPAFGFIISFVLSLKGGPLISQPCMQLDVF